MPLLHFVSLILIAVLAIIIPTNNLSAAAFATYSHSASALANSYAGSTAGAHDISDSFENPANLANIDSRQLIISAAYLDVDIDPDNVHGTYGNNSTATGTEENNAGVNALIPAFFFALPVNDKLSLGINTTVPFGLETKYDKSWVGRYHAIESKIQTANINPAFSYSFNNKLSVGAGLQFQYIQGVLTKMVDANGSGTSDAFGKAKGDDWGYGYNFGLKYKINPKLKIGLGYRSKIEHKIEGKTEVAALNMSSHFLLPLTTPEILTLGINYKINNKFELLYDTSWTRWSRIKNMSLTATENSSLNESSILNWQDSFKYSLGLNYRLNQKLLLRSGTAYEQRAVDKYRRPSVPSGDRIWASLGFEYKFKPGMKIDLAYLHQFHSKVSSNLEKKSITQAIDVGSLSADYKNSLNTFAIGFGWEF